MELALFRGLTLNGSDSFDDLGISKSALPISLFFGENGLSGRQQLLSGQTGFLMLENGLCNPSIRKLVGLVPSSTVFLHENLLAPRSLAENAQFLILGLAQRNLRLGVPIAIELQKAGVITIYVFGAESL